MRCVVTGGSGFIGFNLLRALVESRRFDRIVSLDRLPPPHEIDGVEHVHLDLRHREALRHHLDRVDVVFHLAAAANVDNVQAKALATVEENVGATAILLDASRQAGVGRFVLASTVWVYMGVQQEWLTESTPLVPSGPMNLYASTKVAAEVLCRAYQQQFGLPSTILRFETPYGPHMRPELVVSRFLHQALRGEPITISGDGRQTRNFIHVRDLVNGAVMAALAPIAAGKTYNLPGPEPVSISDLADVVRAVTGSSSRVVFVEGRTHDSHGPQMSRALAETELGWTPTIAIAAGIQDSLAWLARDATPAVAAIR
jgi:UDP-glucose 4-epimerase